MLSEKNVNSHYNIKIDFQTHTDTFKIIYVEITEITTCRQLADHPDP